MKKKKIIMSVGILFVLLCVLSGGIRYYTQWKKTALTRYMEQLKKNTETLETAAKKI